MRMTSVIYTHVSVHRVYALSLFKHHCGPGSSLTVYNKPAAFLCEKKKKKHFRLDVGETCVHHHNMNKILDPKRICWDQAYWSL